MSAHLAHLSLGSLFGDEDPVPARASKQGAAEADRFRSKSMRSYVAAGRKLDIDLAYEVLGFGRDETPTETEVRKRYRELQRVHHPDKTGGDHNEMAALLNQAKSVVLGAIQSASSAPDHGDQQDICRDWDQAIARARTKRREHAHAQRPLGRSQGRTASQETVLLTVICRQKSIKIEEIQIEVTADMKVGTIKERIAVGMNLRPAALRLLLHQGGRELSDSQTIANYNLVSAGSSLVAEVVGERVHNKIWRQSQELAKTLTLNSNSSNCSPSRPAMPSKHVSKVGGAFIVFENGPVSELLHEQLLHEHSHHAAAESSAASARLSSTSHAECASSRDRVVGTKAGSGGLCRTRKLPKSWLRLSTFDVCARDDDVRGPDARGARLQACDARDEDGSAVSTCGRAQDTMAAGVSEAEEGARCCAKEGPRDGKEALEARRVANVNVPQESSVTRRMEILTAEVARMGHSWAARRILELEFLVAKERATSAELRLTLHGLQQPPQEEEQGEQDAQQQEEQAHEHCRMHRKDGRSSCACSRPEQERHEPRWEQGLGPETTAGGETVAYDSVSRACTSSSAALIDKNDEPPDVAAGERQDGGGGGKGAEGGVHLDCGGGGGSIERRADIPGAATRQGESAAPVVPHSVPES